MEGHRLRWAAQTFLPQCFLTRARSMAWKQIGSQPMSKLTKRVVDAAEVRPGDYFIWDGDLPGFGLRVFPSGRKRYIVQYRAGRRSRRISLGPSTVLTCEQARSQAIAILAACRNGDDPAIKREAGRKAIMVRSSQSVSIRNISHSV